MRYEIENFHKLAIFVIQILWIELEIYLSFSLDAIHFIKNYFDVLVGSLLNLGCYWQISDTGPTAKKVIQELFKIGHWNLVLIIVVD